MVNIFRPTCKSRENSLRQGSGIKSGGYDPSPTIRIRSGEKDRRSSAIVAGRNMALCECRKSGPFSGGARTLRPAVRGVLRLCGQQGPDGVDRP